MEPAFEGGEMLFPGLFRVFLACSNWCEQIQALGLISLLSQHREQAGAPSLWFLPMDADN